MKGLCIINIKLNTLTDVHTKLQWVGHLFTYVKSCERGRVKDFEQRSCVYYVVHYNSFFSMNPDIMESQCTIYHHLKNKKLFYSSYNHNYNTSDHQSENDGLSLNK